MVDFERVGGLAGEECNTVLEVEPFHKDGDEALLFGKDGLEVGDAVGGGWGGGVGHRGVGGGGERGRGRGRGGERGGRVEGGGVFVASDCDGVGGGRWRRAGGEVAVEEGGDRDSEDTGKALEVFGGDSVDTYAAVEVLLGHTGIGC